MRVKPNTGRLVVRALTEEETTASGIVVFRLNQKETATKGKIVAVPKECPWDEGDIVLYPPFAGDAFRIEENGKWIELRIIRFDSVLASCS